MKYLIAILTLTLAACATNPDKIPAAYVSSTEYDGYTCQQLQDAKAQNNADFERLYKTMDKRDNTNKTGAIVGAILFWPALFFMKDKNPEQDARLAELKGRDNAITTAMTRCN